MILTIAKKEFAEMWRDGRFRWSALIVFLLLVMSLSFGWRSYSLAGEELRAAQEDSRRTWLEQGNRNPHSAAHFGVYAFKQKTPAGLIDPGLDAYTGNSIWVEAHYQNPARNRPIEDSTSLQRFGELSAAGVVLFLLPLLVIFLTFDSFAGERERGNLREAAASGIGMRTLAAGKLLGIGAVIALLLVPIALLGSAAVAFSSGGPAVAGEAPRLAGMFVAYSLYLFAFLGLGVAVSAWARSSKTALVVLIGFWVFAALLLPRIVNEIAAAAYPLPTAQEFWAAVDKDTKEGIDGHDPQNKRTKELEERVLAQYGVAKKEDLPINFSGLSLQASEEHANRVYDKHYGELQERHRDQKMIVDLAGLLSPVIAARSASMGFAGSDLDHQQHFTGEVELYRRDLQKILNDDLAYNSNPKTASTYAVGREFWEKTPDLEYQRPSFGWVASRQWLNTLLLAAWVLAAIGAALFAAGRTRID